MRVPTHTKAINIDWLEGPKLSSSVCVASMISQWIHFRFFNAVNLQEEGRLAVGKLGEGADKLHGYPTDLHVSTLQLFVIACLHVRRARVCFKGVLSNH